ncbi:MAG: hypothetical protein KIG88_01650 [Weeksellaceae bacterium]|jgi:hypothetical protein|nr:hypothetical protein [Weeksellaceae bacterium]
MDLDKNRVIIFSDVDKRDGIGIEVYQDDKLILEIFRDDTKRTKKATFFQQEISLDILEKSIETFKKEIPFDFID